MGNYLAARDYLKSQQPELAWKEIYDATAKSGFQDYTTERLQGLEEMYLDSGRSAAEAKALAMMSLQLPHLMLLRDLGKEMSAIEQQSFAAGDAAAAQTTARLGLALAGNLSGEGSPTLLGQLVGLSVERKFLNGLDPNGSYDFLPQTVSERLGQLQAREKSIREAARFFDPWMKSASEAELIGYFDRMKIYGEAAAVSWAQNRVRDRGP